MTDLYRYCESDEDIVDCSDEDGNEDDEWSDADSTFDETEYLNSELYPGAPITVAEFLLCVSAIKLRNQASDEIIKDFLALVAIICITPHKCPTSLYKFKQFFASTDVPIKKHYYCPKCITLINNSETDLHNDESIDNEAILDNIYNCGCTDFDKGSYFIEIPLISQLEYFFQCPGNYNKINNTLVKETTEVDLQENDDDITYKDIDDGSIYKELSQENRILFYENSLAFMWYTDGIQIFKSSKYSIWAFYLIMLNLPFEERYRIQNMILVALWFGDKKPDPNLFLNPLKKSLRNLFKGVNMYVKDLNDVIKFRGIIICGTADLPAKSLFLQMNQYNGKFGCQVCTDEGETVDRRRVYKHTDNFEIRTEVDTLEHAQEALDRKVAVFGVKGPTVISKICYNFITSTIVDIMHCLFQGQTKKMLELWFDPKYKNENFSIYVFVDVVDYRLCSIKPPSHVQRRPRPIKTHLSYWKSSNLKDWLLYYALPTLNGILPTEYYDHFKLLVFASYVLCQEKITSSVLSLAEAAINKFSSQFEYLYGLTHMSCNLHSLRHLPAGVRKTGPCKVTSCFPLEDLNGKLKALIHGSKSPHLQIVFNLSLYIKMYVMKNDWLNENSKASSFCKSLLSPTKKLKLHNVNNIYSIVGPLSKLKENNPYKNLITNHFVDSNIFVFKRLYKERILYSSEIYQHEKKTQSYYVKYLSNDELRLGIIKMLVRVTTCKCKNFCECNARCFALIENLEFKHPLHVNLQNAELFFIHECTRTSNNVIVNVRNLKHVCFHVFIKDINVSYVIDPVSTFEYE